MIILFFKLVCFIPMVEINLVRYDLSLIETIYSPFSRNLCALIYCIDFASFSDVENRLAKLYVVLKVITCNSELC